MLDDDLIRPLRWRFASENSRVSRRRAGCPSAAGKQTGSGRGRPHAICPWLRLLFPSIGYGWKFRQLADLGVKLGRLTLALLLAIARTGRPARKQARDVVENLLLPGINLVRMHPCRFASSGNRRILAQRLERNLRLERRIKLLA